MGHKICKLQKNKKMSTKETQTDETLLEKVSTFYQEISMERKSEEDNSRKSVKSTKETDRARTPLIKDSCIYDGTEEIVNDTHTMIGQLDSDEHSSERSDKKSVVAIEKTRRIKQEKKIADELITSVSDILLEQTDDQVVHGIDACSSITSHAKHVAEYCVPLLQVRFCGQTNSASRSDTSDTKEVLNLGLYLQLLNKFLHQFNKVVEFTGTEEEYCRLLKLVAFKRKQVSETTDQCFQRILADSQRFVKIYHKRGFASQHLEHKKFWGSRQQMLAGKVIADWIDPEGGPLDPIFGVLLQPTGGRAGRGDSCWMHNILFDDMGHFAYHSAVHDAFGYLITHHGIGPGYDYLDDSIFNENNPLAGQLSGVSFWKELIAEVEKKPKHLDCVHL